MSSGAEDSTPKDALIGRWTYRSFRSNPDIDVDFGDLEFGRGELLVEYACWGKFIGRLVLGDDYEFRLTGAVTPGDPPTISLDGFGDATESKGQHYQYFACVMPLWGHDPRKRPTIVGSVKRAAPKKGSTERAGSAAVFIAVKQDDLPEPKEAKPADASASAQPASGSATGSAPESRVPSEGSAPASGAPSESTSGSGASPEPSAPAGGGAGGGHAPSDRGSYSGAAGGGWE